MKIILRVEHDKNMIDHEHYKRDFEECVKIAEYLESLQVGEITISSQEDSWSGHNLSIIYKDKDFGIVNDWKGKFHCGIQDRNAWIWKRDVIENAPYIQTFTTMKLTAKKLTATLDRELDIFDACLAMEETKKKEGIAKFEKAKSQLDYIALCLGLTTIDNGNEYKIESDKITAPIDNAIHVSIDARYNVSTYRVQNLYNMFNKVVQKVLEDSYIYTT